MDGETGLFPAGESARAGHPEPRVRPWAGQAE